MGTVTRVAHAMLGLSRSHRSREDSENIVLHLASSPEDLRVDFSVSPTQ